MDQVGSIGTWTRDQLEDQYLRLYDDYLTLKKHACKQEERIKKMATRLLRLASDKKYIEAHPVVEEEYKEQIANLQKRNAQLTQQLQLAKNHLKVQKFSFRSSPSLSRPLSGANIRTLGSSSKEEKARDISATGALQTARMQNAALEQTIRHLSEQIRQKEQSIGQLKEDMLLKETAHQKDLEELIRQLTNKQRDHLKENLCLIRNQREIREKQSRITTLEARLHESETDNESTKEANRKLISEVERLTHEVGQLEQQLAEMQSKCHVLSKDQLKVMQLQCTIDDLKRENKVLKEANGKLITNALPNLSDQNWVQQEKKLRSRIAQLESLLQERMEPPTNREKAETVLCESLTRVLSAPSEKSKQDSGLSNTVGGEATSSFNQAAGFTQQDLDEALALLREQKTQKSIAATALESMDHGTSREEGTTV